MDIFKLASQQKLRFQTSKGLLTTEQLWDLSIAELDNLAVTLNQEYEESGKKSFLVKKSIKDKKAKLSFDVVYDILNTKVEENETARQKAEDKAHNEKILNLIAEKQDESLKGKSVAELKKLLK